MVKERYFHVFPFLYTLFAAKMPPLSGYEFARKVVLNCNGSVDRLLRILNCQEDPAVEFKASFRPSAKDLENAHGREVELRDACSWNVISDIIAIANTSGGCLLLGIRDKDGKYAEGYLDGLSEDEYKRRFQETLEKKEWMQYEEEQKGGNNNEAKRKKFKKIFSLDEDNRQRLKQCVEGIHKLTVSNKTIFLVLIRRIRDVKDQYPIVYREKVILKDTGEPIGSKEILVYRAKVGAKKIPIPAELKAISEFMGNGFPEPTYDNLWDRFLGGWESKRHLKSVIVYAVLFLLISVLQVLFAKGALCKRPEKCMYWVFCGPLFFAILYLLYYTVVKPAKDVIITLLNLCWMNCWVVLGVCCYLMIDKLSCGQLIGIGIFALLATSAFCWLILPNLVPLRHKAVTYVEGWPLPGSIIVPHACFTIESRCMDGNFFWETEERVDTPYGPWKLLKHRSTGHYRILDPMRCRRCYGWQAKVVPIFEEVKKKIHPPVEQPEVKGGD